MWLEIVILLQILNYLFEFVSTTPSYARFGAKRHRTGIVLVDLNPFNNHMEDNVAYMKIELNIVVEVI